MFLALNIIAPKPITGDSSFDIHYLITKKNENPDWSKLSTLKSPISLEHQGGVNDHWLKINFSNLTHYKDPAISLSPFILTDVYIYTDEDLSTPKRHINRFLFDDKLFNIRQNNIIRLSDFPSSKNLYIKIREYRSFTAKVEAWEFDEFLAQDRKTNTFFSAILFGIFIMVIVNCFFYITIRDKAYLWYILYHSSMLILVLNVTGYLYHYPVFEILGNTMSKGIFTLALTSFCFAKFARHFLNTPLYTPKLDKVIDFYLITYGISMVALLVLPWDDFFLPAVNLVAVTGIAYYLLIMIFHLKAGNRQAVFFTLAFITMLVVLIFRFLYVWDFVPQSFFTQYGVMVAILLEAIVFSIGLTDRILRLRQQRDSAELEKAKTTFVYNLEKDFNRLVGKINTYIHESEDDDHKQYIIDQFFQEFKDKLAVNSNAVVYKVDGEVKTIADTRHKSGYHFDIIAANTKQIAFIAKSGKSKTIIGRHSKFLVVPAAVRNHEWSACVFELDKGFKHNPTLDGFLNNYSSELIRSLLHSDSLSRIKAQAEIDELTKVYNRRGIKDFIRHELERPFNQNNPLSIAFVDVDNFKDINDQFGHKAGDLCLKYLTKTFKQNFPLGVQIGRFGGDEFLIVLPETNQFRALNIINRAKNKLQPIEHNHKYITFTISVGIAAQLNANESIENLLEQADRALYESKEGGKNTISVA